MNIIDIQREIKNGMFYPVYLFYGTENFLIEDTKQKLIQKTLSEEDRDFNLSFFDMAETPIQAAIEDAETLPFMGERRVVIVQNAYFLTAQKNDQKVEHDLKQLERYIEDPSSESIVMMIAPYEKLDERKKVVKAIKKRGGFVHAAPLTEKEIKQWLNQQAKERRVSIEPEAVALLLETVGPDLMMLSTEMDKLSLYAFDTGEITVKMVEMLASRSLEQNIFSLTDMVLKRDLQKAMRIFYDMLEQKEEPIKILALLTQQFRLLYQVKGLASRGYGQSQIASTLKVHPFRVKLAMQKANLFEMNELLRLMDELAEVDYRIKSGKLDKQLAVELFLMKLKKE
ncbi:DNA polymerase III subunit delta [Bacillus tianshenii]|nr:DNA polymerase III subunit delta [Bacillus tianshenii]